MNIPTSMYASVYRGANDLRIEEVPVPRITGHELLVKVAVCGVCPTDIKKIQYGTVPPPRIFGHETAGTIVRVGKGVSGFKVGDRVAVHHHVPCMDCHACRHRAFAQCDTYKKTGITAGFEPAGGGFAEYVRVMPFVLPGVVRIPDKNSFEEGAMLEPVNTVLKAVKRLNLIPGDNVIVAGQGPIGLMFTRILQLQGMNVLATDLLDSRLKLAREFGARWAVKPSDLEKSGNRMSDVGYRLVHRRRLDAAVLAVPSDAAVQQAMELVRGAGQVLLFAHTKRAIPAGNTSGGSNPPEAGHAPGKRGYGANSRSLRRDRGAGAGKGKGGSGLFPVDLASICVDEKDLIGSYSADFTLQSEVARLVFSRKLDVRPLISHRFPLEKTAEAVDLAANPTPESLKVVVCS